MIRPKLEPILAMILATSLIWALGIYGIVRDPSDYNAYLLLLGSIIVIGYVATERIEVSDEKIAFYRYFVKRSEADVQSVDLINARVGRPPVLNGLAVVTHDEQRRIGEIIPWNYRKEDIRRLTDALSS